MRKQYRGITTKFELKGLITREPSPDDRRVTNVTLTDAGKIVAESLEAEQRERKNIFAGKMNITATDYQGIGRSGDTLKERDFEENI